MSIKVRYFASLAERVGCSESDFDFKPGLSVSDIWLIENAGRVMPENILAAIDLEYVSREVIVEDGAELAFFPPVTGG